MLERIPLNGRRTLVIIGTMVLLILAYECLDHPYAYKWIHYSFYMVLLALTFVRRKLFPAVDNSNIQQLNLSAPPTQSSKIKIADGA